MVSEFLKRTLPQCMCMLDKTKAEKNINKRGNEILGKRRKKSKNEQKLKKAK